MEIKNIGKKIKRFPKGKFGEINSSVVTKENLLKEIYNKSIYIQTLQDSLGQKEALTEEEITEVENLNRILENKKKYEAEDKISKTAINKNIVKLEELESINQVMIDGELEEYDPSEYIDISDIEEII